jgi:hypothetical protein
MVGNTTQELDNGKVTNAEIMEWDLWMRLGPGKWAK